MSKAKFKIGEKEKHTIARNANLCLKCVRIEADGKRVIDVPNFIPSRKLDLKSGEEKRVKWQYLSEHSHCSSYRLTERKQ